MQKMISEVLFLSVTWGDLVTECSALVMYSKWFESAKGEIQF